MGDCPGEATSTIDGLNNNGVDGGPSAPVGQAVSACSLSRLGVSTPAGNVGHRRPSIAVVTRYKTRATGSVNSGVGDSASATGGGNGTPLAARRCNLMTSYYELNESKAGLADDVGGGRDVDHVTMTSSCNGGGSLDGSGSEQSVVWMDLSKLGSLFSHEGSNFYLRLGALS